MKNTILMSLADKLPSTGEVVLRNKLDGVSDETLNKISASIPMLNLKSPGAGLVLGLLFGGLGVDRFWVYEAFTIIYFGIYFKFGADAA